MAQRHLNPIQNLKQIIDASEANFTELYEGGGGGGTVQSATINGNTITPDANKNLALGNYATQTDFNGVTAKIPSAASSSNQLADKAFVNSSINNVASYYITKNANGDAFATKAELNAATTFYSGGVVRQPTRNDYTVVLADESKTITTTSENPTTRYIYNNGWDYQYIVNNSGLTAAQWSAVNSGITSTLVGKITANETAIASKEASGIDLRLDGSNTMTGVLNLKASGNNETNIGSNGIRWNSTSLPEDTTVSYICTMDAFASGGRQKYCSLATLKTKLAVPTTYVTSVNGSSGAVTGLATTASLASYVPTSRKINNKALTSDITLTASDVGAAASSHTHSYLPLAGGTMTGTIKTPVNTVPAILLRDNSSYYAGIVYRTSGNEAVCFDNKNSVTSWIFRTKDTTTNSAAWNDVTPSMQIKNQRVTINKLIANDANAAYNLDVNGTANATTLYENGTSLASKYAALSHTHTKSQITDFPTSMPASDVYSWAKASSKPSYSFSEISSRGEAYLGWGGTNVSGDVSPVGMAISNEHSANRMAFINGAAIACEYSSNAGSSYTDYGLSATNKSALFTTSYSIPIGRASGSTEYTTSSRTRVTITAQNGTTGYVYTNPRKMLINISSSGSMQVLVEYRTGTNYKSSGAWSTFGTYSLSGWSGWNDIPLILGTLGGGTTQTSNNWQLRLTFIMTSKNTSYPTTAQVNSIRIYGSNAWTSPSTMASSGHLYSFDVNQNATFPAGVSATSFTENGTALSTKYQAKLPATGSASTPIYVSSAGTITACTTKFVSYSFASGVLTITA